MSVCTNIEFDSLETNLVCGLHISMIRFGASYPIFILFFCFIFFFFFAAAYHCELNPIEMIWAQLKLYVRQRNTTGKIKDVEKLVLEGIDSITPEDWQNCIRHVIDQENYFWEKDSELLAYEDGELEDVEIGDMEEILAGDVAAAMYNNPSSKHNLSCLH